MCKDIGQTDHDVSHAIYGPMTEFCSCEIGRKKFQDWKNEPKQKELFKERKMERIERLLKRSNVGPRFESKRLEDLKDKPKLFEACKIFVDNFMEYRNQGWGLYLWGNVGAGKTHTAGAVVNELIEKYMIETLFINMAEASNRVKNTFDMNGKQEDSNLFEEMKKVELLVIDDIGVEKVTEWLSEQLFLVINYRYENNLPIIVTSNQSLEDLSTLHKPQIASRLDEMCKSVKFTGFDRRQFNRPGF